MDYLVHHVSKKVDSQVQSVYTARMVTKAGTPPRRLTARGAATRARIIDAAASLVYERGFAGTSLDDVMAATGTSKSQLYHYFADKDALIREVIKAQLGRIIAAQQAAGLHEISSWEALQRWCDHFVTATRATQGAGGCPLGSLVGELADQSEPARHVLAQCFADWQSDLSEGFTVMRDNGELAAQADPRRARADDAERAAGRPAHGPGHAQCPAGGTRPEHGPPAPGRLPAAPRAGSTALSSDRAKSRGTYSIQFRSGS